MSFSPVGSWQLIEPAAGDTTLTTSNVGDLVVAEVIARPAPVFCTGISGGGCSWTQITDVIQGVNNDWSAVVFAGQVVSAGTATCTLSWNGTYGAEHSRFQEYSVTSGNWTLDTWGYIDNAGTADWASLNASGSGELYYGYAHDLGNSVAGSQAGFTYIIDGDGNGIAYDQNSGPGAVQAVWDDTGQAFGVMVLLREVGGSGSGPASGSGLLMASFP